MPRPSLLDAFLSAEAQAELAAFLAAHPAVTVDDFNDMLAERGLAVSRPTAGRAKRKLEDMGRRLRESRMLMDSIGAGLEAEAGSRQGRALLELLRTLMFEFQQALLKGKAEGLESKDFAYLGRTVKDLMQAARLDQDYLARLEEQATMRAANAADEAAARAGYSAETIAIVRAAIEGGETP